MGHRTKAGLESILLYLLLRRIIREVGNVLVAITRLVHNKELFLCQLSDWREHKNINLTFFLHILTSFIKTYIVVVYKV